MHYRKHDKGFRPMHTQIWADQLTLSQPRGADYAHQIVCTGIPGFSDFPTALHDIFRQKPTSDPFVQMECYVLLT